MNLLLDLWLLGWLISVAVLCWAENRMGFVGLAINALILLMIWPFYLGRTIYDIQKWRKGP